MDGLDVPAETLRGEEAAREEATNVEDDRQVLMGERAFTEPSPSDWERIETAVVEDELHPYHAARKYGFTLSQLRRCDPVRHAHLLEMGRDEDRKFVRDKLRENVAQSMTAEPPRGDVANKGLELLGRSAGMFEDTQRVELSGPDGGPLQIEHERRLTLADVAGFARTLDGSHNGASDELPATRPALAEPRES